MSDRNDGPDASHRGQRTDTTVEALGALSKALETTERARGHLYAFHQLTGGADFELDRAVALLREAGHRDWAGRVQEEILGRNVIPGHWTFQIVESYNDTYYEPFKALDAGRPGTRRRQGPPVRGGAERGTPDQRTPAPHSQAGRL